MSGKSIEQNGRKPVGVGGMALYVPRCRVRLEQWCEWAGANPAKVGAVVGRSFRMADARENVYTMAATAVLRLIDATGVDPSDVGMLALGTESSNDNSAGAVIVRGMVDRALVQRGSKPLSRSCEVPELKHACLGGIYGLKAALRYLRSDGAGRKAIVVAGDIAEYARGSTGEPTQGAGAVAMLVEEDPRLFEVDMTAIGSASSYRGTDFRKPMRRHFVTGYEAQTRRMHDFPVFNGRYSTLCYIEAVRRASSDLIAKLPQSVEPASFYDRLPHILFHRPYHKMPADGLGALYVTALADSPSRHGALRELCEAADVAFETVLAEAAADVDLFDHVLAGRHDADAFPATQAVARSLRKTPMGQTIFSKLALGSERMRDLGNLYTAALPAWIAAAFLEAHEAGAPLGDEMLAIGYGSGDAAEALLLRPAPTWREAAAGIAFEQALAGAVDLTREQYEALHDLGDAPGLDATPPGHFVIERVGELDGPEFSDIGIEYYRYVA